MLKYLNIAILMLSGLLITLVSAFFSIKGFTLFLPDKELLYGILGIGIGFELAKIVMSTFLFHRLRDRQFPIFIKFIMSVSVAALIFFSSIFTFVHLNASASQDLSVGAIKNTQIERLTERNSILQARINVINSEIATVNASDKPNTKLRIYNALSPEKDKIEIELADNLLSLSELEVATVENNQYTVLESISKFSGYSKEDIFTYIVLFIVIIIDPLAISLFLAGSYIISEKDKKKQLSELPLSLLSKIDTSINNTTTEVKKPTLIKEDTILSKNEEELLMNDSIDYYNSTFSSREENEELENRLINKDAAEKIKDNEILTQVNDAESARKNELIIKKIKLKNAK